jgi:hypothetical protein
VRDAQGGDDPRQRRRLPHPRRRLPLEEPAHDLLRYACVVDAVDDVFVVAAGVAPDAARPPPPPPQQTSLQNTLAPHQQQQQTNSHKKTKKGTGCIFHYDDAFPQGSGVGFKESDTPNFTGSYYSYTKAMVESLLKEFPNVLTLRVRMPIVPDLTYPRNFIAKIIKVLVVWLVFWVVFRVF